MELGIMQKETPFTKAYLKNERCSHKLHLEFALKTLKSLPKNTRILVIGVCEDDFDIYLGQWFDDVTGIDKRTCMEKGRPPIVMDARKMAFADDSFDLIICLGVLAHANFEVYGQPTEEKEGQIELLKEMYRTLKPRGKLILEVPLLLKRTDSRFITPEEIDEWIHDYREVDREVWKLKMKSYSPFVVKTMTKVERIEEKKELEVFDVLLLLEKKER
jgi:SAM-dependent methyltransferase